MRSRRGSLGKCPVIFVSVIWICGVPASSDFLVRGGYYARYRNCRRLCFLNGRRRPSDGWRVLGHASAEFTKAYRSVHSGRVDMPMVHVLSYFITLDTSPTTGLELPFNRK